MLRLADRLLTIVVTATVTSAAWIVAGGLGIGPTFHRFAGVPPAPEALGSSSAAKPETSVSFVPREGGLIIPVAGIKAGQLIDTFTAARAGGRAHDAIDIMAPAGTPVIAAAAGTVEKLFLSKNGGNTIYLRSPDRRTIHYYAHLQDYAAGLHEGQAVSQGEVLGRVGSSGDANPAAPHLHFQVLQTTPAAKWWEQTTALNPYPLLTH